MAAARQGATSSEGDTTTEVIQVRDMAHVRGLGGERDRNLRILRDTFGVRVVMRGATISLAGEATDVQRAAAVVRELLDVLERDGELPSGQVRRAIDGVQSAERAGEDMRIEVLARGRTVRPKTANQAAYIRAIAQNDLVFCTGPAGTGKTYLAVAMGVSALKRETVRKIILARPAIEAGERLGFLPGDLQAKVNPYLRPLYDALYDMIALDQLRRYMDNDLIEVAPLAYMRGRTLDHAFVILDEGQNCTRKQMKMFLTRLGSASKSVITGDISQTDLPPDEMSGMMEASSILQGVDGIAFVSLKPCDIVRHRLVQEIVDAYDAHDRSRLTGTPEGTERAG